MRTLLDRILRGAITLGTLSVRYPDGRTTTYGGAPGPAVGVAIRDGRTLRRLAIDPTLAIGEAYMDGGLRLVDCALYDLIDMLIVNLLANGHHPVTSVRPFLDMVLRRWAQFNPTGRSHRNVAHHYDLNGQLYSLLLDHDRQYSCAYFPHGGESLDVAQAAKKRHIAAKLLLRPGLDVLDIGCGWGGLALSLAREHGVRVTGITLSTEQLAAARQRAAQEGLQDLVSFQLLDYRHLAQRYDRIVSVGMFEHVGVNHYRRFFTAVHAALKPGGVALIHAIMRANGPRATNPWIAKYIFPGGYTPALSEVLPAIERSKLWVTDIEVLRLHYAETLRHWRRNFTRQHDTIAALYDERFCRMFEFYLASSEVTFRRGGHMVAQIQLATDIDAVPMTRDYIMEAEHPASTPQDAPAS